jgi:hypothetical protein
LGFGQRHLCFGLLERGRGGIDLLLRRRRLRQAFLTVVVSLGPEQVGLGIGKLRLRLLKLCREILARYLGAEFQSLVLCLRRR